LTGFNHPNDLIKENHFVHYLNHKLALAALLSASVLLCASCTPEKKADSDGTTTISIVPGEAGGVIQDTFTTSATVNVIDPSTRVINLTASDGSKASFKAPPEVRNFDQIRVGDKVNATIAERLVIFVRSSGEDPSIVHAAALAAAPKGAKPGVMVGEAYEITANVTSIDMINRKATLKFVDGQTMTVTARPDVDLTKYKVGDTVVIRVTATLTVLVEKP
jgi:hypothetical protein